jgi:membrane-associated protease RseP (regulator of RpoE activity)
LAIVSTLFAIFAYSISAYALNPTIFDAIVNKNDISSLAICFPIFWGVLGLSALHELAHFVTAKRLKMDIGVPIPIPSLQIGTFGNITPLRSFPENRSDLLDFSLSGPLATFVVSLLCLVVGIFQTIHSPSDLIPTLATVPVALFKSSLLVGSIVSFLAPKVMMLPLSQPIPVHPLFMIGLAGIVSSALNLLPIGRLDGGRASTAIFGRRSSYIISILTLAFLALAALTGSSTTSIFWGFIVTVFQRLPEIPVRDEISEVDNVRFGLYVLSVVITILVLTPFPGALNAI